MNLTGKASLIIGLNLLMTMLFGLLIREFWVLPDFQAAQSAKDSHAIARALEGVSRFQREMEVQALLRHRDLNIADIANSSAPMSRSAEIYYHNAVRIGEAGDSRLAAVLTELAAPEGRSSGILKHNDISVLWTAVPETGDRPALVLARSLSDALTADIGHGPGIGVTLIDQMHFNDVLKHHSAQAGIRIADGNFLVTSLNNKNGETVAWLRLDLTGDGFLNAVSIGRWLMPFVLALPCWLLALLSLNRHISAPLKEFTGSLDAIRSDANYSHHLHYAGKGEMKQLARAANSLVANVRHQITELESFSYTDPLTGCSNRRSLEDRLTTLWSISRRERQSISAITFDLDHFKAYNDSLGHAAGDEALRQFAQLLKRQFARSTDLVCRSGGEEFIVLLHNTSTDNCEALTQSLMDALRILRIPHPESSTEPYLTASAGIATIIPDENTNSDALLKLSDDALYRAKDEGRNRMSVATNSGVVSFFKRRMAAPRAG